jgi:hypothetical protein
MQAISNRTARRYWGPFLCSFCSLFLTVHGLAAPNSTSGIAPRAATVVVATKDSSERSKTSADFLGDGEGDQEEINAAIRALPEVGGTVLLMEGTYDIRRVPGRLGGVLVERSNVVLAGQGTATRLVQAPGQETNVIRIIGSGVGHVTIRDLVVDANRDGNPLGGGDPNVGHSRFEFCGIKAYCAEPGKSPDAANHDITIRNTVVRNARSLGIMLEGTNMRVLDNVLGNAMSDSVEILTGPGQVRGNYVEITGRTHVAIGSDRGNSILMTNNVIHVKEGGDLDIGFRSWADSHRHVIADNVVTVDPGGKCKQAMDVRGYEATVTGNNVHASDPNTPVRLTISGGNTIVTGNVFENVVIEVNDSTGRNKPIVISDNIMETSLIQHKAGKLTTRQGNR